MSWWFSSLKSQPTDPKGQYALLLRRHFTTRSVQFLVPLTRYLNTLIPPHSSAAASPTVSGKPLALKSFNRDHFFSSLKTHGSPLPFRSASRQKEFYERWLRSPAFGLWMARQEETINEYLRRPTTTTQNWIVINIRWYETCFDGFLVTFFHYSMAIWVWCICILSILQSSRREIHFH